MERQAYIDELRNLDNEYYDINFDFFSTWKIREMLYETKYPFACLGDDGNYTNSIDNREFATYSNGIRQRRRRYEWWT